MHRFCTILFTNILWISIRLKLIRNIDDDIVYKTTGAHAAELRGGTFRHALDSLANPNPPNQLTNQSPSCISEGGAS